MKDHDAFWSALRGEHIPSELRSTIIARARDEGVLPYLASLHRDLPNRAEIRRSAAAAEIARSRLLEAIRRALDPLSIAWVVLKGAELAYRLYDDPVDRPSGDCDVLVLPEDRRRVEVVLQAAGFHASHDHAELWIGTLGAIDLHVSFVNAERIRGREAAYRGYGEWEKKRIWIQTSAGKIPVLGLDDLARYLTLHIVHHHGACGARWLVDISRLLERHPDLRGRIADCGPNGRLVLRIVDALLGEGAEAVSGWLERVTFESAYGGHPPVGLRFLLSARDMTSWGDRLRFLTELTFPSRRILRSSTVGARSPIRAHGAKLLQSAFIFFCLGRKNTIGNKSRRDKNGPGAIT